MFESTGLVDPSWSDIEWAASMNPPTFRERAAARAFREFQRRLHPWWLMGLPWGAYFALQAYSHRENRDFAVLYLFSGLLIVALRWLHQGYFELLQRYDTELRQLRQGRQH